MRLPPPIQSVRNLRWFRVVALISFLAVLVIAVGSLLVGRWATAGAFALSAAIFGFNWQSARTVTLLLEQWHARCDASGSATRSPRDI